MGRNQVDIDAILQKWPYQPGTIRARVVRARGGREVLQMRIELGILQMETAHRPDGERPGGADTYLDHLRQLRSGEKADFLLTEEQCAEMDREFVQYYQRRVCWLALRHFDRVVADADHTLALMDFASEHSPSDDWTRSHEQYRPFVVFHRTQAASLAALEKEGPDAAIEAVSAGLERIRQALREGDQATEIEDDSLVRPLLELRQWVREQYHVGRTLGEQLSDAVAKEQYELAAKLRDEIARRRSQTS
jgi:hypothetical protein